MMITNHLLILKCCWPKVYIQFWRKYKFRKIIQQLWILMY